LPAKDNGPARLFGLKNFSISHLQKSKDAPNCDIDPLELARQLSGSLDM
jgi:hypothetical protein